MMKPTRMNRAARPVPRRPAAGMPKMAPRRVSGPRPTTSTPIQTAPAPVPVPLVMVPAYKKGGMVKKGAAKKPMSKSTGYKKGGMVKKYRGGGCVMGKRGMPKTKKS